MSCYKAVQPDRSCQVTVAAEKVYLSPVVSSDDSNRCGRRDGPWLLEAPTGQRINVSLLDFSAASTDVRTVDSSTTASSRRSGCPRQLGFIEDKSAAANRNLIDICSDAHRQQSTLYVSQSNELALVLQHTTANNFLIAVRGSSKCNFYARQQELL